MEHDELSEDARRRYRTPYTDKRKIPTISKYRVEQELRQERARAFEGRSGAEQGEEHAHLGAESWKEDGEQGGEIQQHGGEDSAKAEGHADDNAAGEEMKDTSEASTSATDPRARRKSHQKHHKRDRKQGDSEAAEREVTDPVTHLPVRIRDYTDSALEEVPENQPHYGSTTQTATGVGNKGKSGEELEEEEKVLRRERAAMQAVFPPPGVEGLKGDLVVVHRRAVGVGVVGMGVVVAVLLGVKMVLESEVLAPQKGSRWPGLPTWSTWLILLGVGVLAMAGLVYAIRDWMTKKIDAVWEDELWHAKRQEQDQSASKKREAESVAWLNSLLAAVWPLVNPDLFTSLADTLEDVMQASLPKLVRMVSVEDIGQGSESIQILGIKWLPTGAAARSVTEDGNFKKQNKSGEQGTADGDGKNGKEASEENEDEQHSKDDDQQEDGTQQPVAQGLEGEEGDFVNVEVAFAYRARPKSKTMSERSKDSHIYLAFYLPGNIKVPVWVELRGVVGSMRMRLQLCPDPPFFSLCTLTFLGQPKVSMSCVPLSRYAVNVMDVPLISNFVQASLDAAMAEYVAPKSLNLDLKDMLAGDDFKKDTSAHGVLVVNVKRGYEFKMGDAGIPFFKEGSSDPYVSVGWAKFGKPVWSTRLLLNEMEPYWDETCYVLVTQQELNVDERLRVQLWDSDRVSADDDLGRIEVDLKELMKNQKSRGKMWHRCDGFRALKAGENMPGKLEWSVGYYPKTRIQQDQLEKQSFDCDVRSLDQLEEKVDSICARKLREANIKRGRHSKDANELDQQKSQEMKEREDAMIISAPPPDGYPSGIFSIQIHQITGLELAKLSKDASNADAEASDEEEAGEGLPSAYCNVIINHKKVFRTRTKPANAKPFYNAGTERYLPDWRQAEVHVSVRDARVKEDDALLGIVHLPLAQVFKDRAQVNGFFPLVGGVGYGRIRISMVWRSIQLQAPPEALGWEHGTLQIGPEIKSESLPEDLKGLKLKFAAPLGRGKMYPHEDAGAWTTRHHNSSRQNKDRKPLKLGVRLRYSSPITIAFEDKSLFGDKTRAFCVLWLKDLPDEEQKTLTLPVWKGDFERASKNCFPQNTSSSTSASESAAQPDDSVIGEKVGEIKIDVTFWPGLGAAHSKWAKKDRNVRNVAEVLATARDNFEEVKNEEAAGIVDDPGADAASTNTAKSDTDSDGDGDDDDDDVETNDSSDNEDGEGIQGIKKSATEFKRKQEGLGRKHRGLMQWRLPRTAKWGVGKVRDVEGKFRGMFRHGEFGDRGQGVETEV